MFKTLDSSMKFVSSIIRTQSGNCCNDTKPQHLICFKQWTAPMVMDVINSAIALKYRHRNTHCTRLDLLKGCKVVVLKQVNEPNLNLAVSKAATFMGAYDVTVIDQLMWDNDYLGRIFSLMSDVIFVSTNTHTCVERFAGQSTVPVLCIRSRTHASLQSLATVMAIIEEYGTMKGLDIAYMGSPHPVLNSYLLLCPMLGANIRFKCCCNRTPVSPLLTKASEDLVEKTHTVSKSCMDKCELLANASVIIAGPSKTPASKDKVKEFKLDLKDILGACPKHWIFFHTTPRGPEVSDRLFENCNARTFEAFENLHYIAASLMAYAVKRHRFT